MNDKDKNRGKDILEVMLMIIPCLEINNAGNRYHKAVHALMDASMPKGGDMTLVPGLKQTLLDAITDLRKAVEAAENEMLHSELDGGEDGH